jgi:hypothetical protein
MFCCWMPPHYIYTRTKPTPHFFLQGAAILVFVNGKFYIIFRVSTKSSIDEKLKHACTNFYVFKIPLET